MKTIVVRTALVLVALCMALFAWVGAAAAQDYTPANPQLPYDGPFPANTDFGVDQGALGFGLADAKPGDGEVVGGTGGGGGLALTGSATELPAVIAISLMGVGGAVLVAARRREN